MEMGIDYGKLFEFGLGGAFSLALLGIIARFLAVVAMHTTKIMDALTQHLTLLSTLMTKHDAEAQLRAKQYDERSRQSSAEHREIITIAQNTNFLISQAARQMKDATEVLEKSKAR